MELAKFGDDVLHSLARPIEQWDHEMEFLASEMIEFMRANGGAGLSAPQIGKGISLFVVEYPKGITYVFGNPRLTLRGGTNKAQEGCLSIPGALLQVERRDQVKIWCQFPHMQTINTDGWLARIIQHEYDHLQGILITDRAGDRV